MGRLVQHLPTPRADRVHPPAEFEEACTVVSRLHPCWRESRNKLENSERFKARIHNSLLTEGWSLQSTVFRFFIFFITTSYGLWKAPEHHPTMREPVAKHLTDGLHGKVPPSASSVSSTAALALRLTCKRSCWQSSNKNEPRGAHRSSTPDSCEVHARGQVAIGMPLNRTAQDGPYKVHRPPA